MVDFTFHTAETAPEAAKGRLEIAQKSMGFVPALWAAQAEAPALLEGYQTLSAIFDKSSFDATERQVVMMTANFDHSCTFCMATHSWLSKIQGVSADVIEALRNDAPFANSKHEALRQFTRAVLKGRGQVSDSETNDFLSAGYTNQQILEVILGISLKVMSNYTNRFAKTPLNDALKSFEWVKPSQIAAE